MSRYNVPLIINIKRSDVRYSSNTLLCVAASKLENSTALASELFTQGDRSGADVKNFIIASNKGLVVT